MIVQDKDKYDAPKYRFVVRKSNKFITCQVVSSRIGGDEILASANSSELPEYGVKVGLANYSTAYTAGLLCARRLLTKLKMDSVLKGNTAVGKFFEPVEDEERRCFKCFLDIGLQRTSTGANLFGALKGGVDGGLNIPYKGTRLVKGYYDAKTSKYNEPALANRIYGNHVSEYMKMLEKEDPDMYKEQFSQYIKAGVKADGLKKMYDDAHKAIRAKPLSTKQRSPKFLAKDARKAKRQEKHAKWMELNTKRAGERVKAKQAMVAQLKK